MDPVTSWVVQSFLAMIGALAGFLVLLPKKWGEGLLKAHFDKELESFKNEQNAKIERLRADLNHLGDRGRRSNEMEFQAVKLVWEKFVKAWLSTNTCIGQMMRIPLFEHMSDDEFETFLSRSTLSDGERSSLASASDRGKEYASILSWRMVIEAGTDIYEARQLLREQRIFMHPELTAEFGRVIEKMNGAQVQRRLSIESPHIPEPEFGNASLTWLGECQNEFEKLAVASNARLFRNEQMDPA